MSDTQHVLTDYEKVSTWNDLAETRGWAVPHYLGTWLTSKNVYFSHAGSAVSFDSMIEKIETKEGVDIMMKELSMSIISEIVLKFLTGNMIGANVEIEVHFWRSLIKKLKDQQIEFPDEIVSGYIQYAMREYYKDENI